MCVLRVRARVCVLCRYYVLCVECCVPVHSSVECPVRAVVSMCVLFCCVVSLSVFRSEIKRKNNN